MTTRPASRVIRKPVLLIDTALSGGRGDSEVSVRNLPTATLKAYLDDQPDLAHLETRLLSLPLDVDELSYPESATARALGEAGEIVVIQTWIFDLHAVKRLCRALRESSPETVIVLGGPAAAGQAASLLSSGAADAVVRGDWEFPVAEILRRGGAGLESIPGVATSAGGARGAPHVLPDLAPVPSPYLRGFLAPRRDTIGIEESRGCPYRCAYCYVPVGFGGGVRVSPVDRLRSELLWARERGCAAVTLYACNLDPSSERFQEVGEAARSVFGDRRVFRILLDAYASHPRLAARLASSPVAAVKFGVQSLSPAALAQAGRGARRIARMEEIARLGLRVTAEVILGLPGDTFESFTSTLERLAGSGVADVTVNWAMAIPGTPMGDAPERRGISAVCEDGVPYVLETATMPRGEMARALAFVSELTWKGRASWVDAEPSRMFAGVPAMRRRSH